MIDSKAPNRLADDHVGQSWGATMPIDLFTVLRAIRSMFRFGSDDDTNATRTIEAFGANPSAEPATNDQLLALLRACPDEWLKIWKVDKKVRAVRNTGPEFAEPIL